MRFLAVTEICCTFAAHFTHHAQKGLFHANLLHTLLELFPVTDGTILDFGAIIIDSVHRIVKELGKLYP